MEWPVENTAKRAVASIIPYARNARTHTEEQVAQIAASITEWGWTMPVLIDENDMIIAGHGRVLAAQKLGIEEISVVIASGWTDAQKRAYVLADNKLALNAGWDAKLLHSELLGLQEFNFNIGLVGFSAAELKAMAPRQFLTDPEALPEPLPVVISEPGDIWLLGAHRLACGDSTDKATVELLLDGAKPHLMVTDPPYGVNYDADWRNHAARNSAGMGNRAIGAGAIGKVKNDDRADWSAAYALFPGEVAYIWHAGVFTGLVEASLKGCNFEMRAQIIWAKQQFAIGRGHYHWKHEPCWYAVRKGGTGHWSGDRKQTTVWDIDKPQKSETGHSTQKPVECMKRPIENNSKLGDSVYEPFSGSGTTIIAGEMTERAIMAIEIDPAYVDLAVRRWQDFTGKPAMLLQTGQSFEDVRQERSESNGQENAAVELEDNRGHGAP